MLDPTYLWTTKGWDKPSSVTSITLCWREHYLKILQFESRSRVQSLLWTAVSLQSFHIHSKREVEKQTWRWLSSLANFFSYPSGPWSFLLKVCEHFHFLLMLCIFFYHENLWKTYNVFTSCNFEKVWNRSMWSRCGVWRSVNCWPKLIIKLFEEYFRSVSIDISNNLCRAAFIVRDYATTFGQF